MRDPNPTIIDPEIDSGVTMSALTDENPKATHVSCSSRQGPTRGLFGKSGAITPHSKSVSSYACMIQLPQLGSLNHIAIPLGIPFMSS